VSRASRSIGEFGLWREIHDVESFTNGHFALSAALVPPVGWQKLVFQVIWTGSHVVVAHDLAGACQDLSSRAANEM
jgi:hypothetical protein